METSQKDLAWRVGGPQMSGVDTAAKIFAYACASAGFHLFGGREYYSNIMGRHSYYNVRVSDRPLISHRESVDLLAAFEAETLVRHAIVVNKGGGIVYNADDEDVSLGRITFLDQRAKDALAAYLEERDMPQGTAGVLEDARRRGVPVFGIPFDEITAALAKELDVGKAIADRSKNTIAVAVCCALLGLEPMYAVKALEMNFAGRQRIIDMNVLAVERTFAYVEENLDTSDLTAGLDPQPSDKERLLVNGNQASALGKLAGGLTFQTYYPISPSTGESVYLEGNEQFPQRNSDDKGSVVVVQTEDELAAITMASGAALTGARSSTATSGPGFSLMAEGVGWAGINEVPLVISLYQRGGPSTGMPTRSEQGDLQFAIRAGHGEFPRMVLASGDITESFYDAAQTFNYAERYQVVVIHLLDKALASSSQTLPPFDVNRISIERGEVAQTENGRPETGSFPRFALTESGVSPRPLLGQPGGTHWLTGGEHTIYGRVTEDPVVREQMMEKRARKLDLMLQELSRDEKVKVYGAEDASFTILTWGSNKGAILEAIERLAADGIKARLVQQRLLWPFPTELITELIADAVPLVVAELNFSGQYAQLLQEQTGRSPDHLVIKYNGRPMSGEALYRTFTEIHEGRAEQRIVLRNPNE